MTHPLLAWNSNIQIELYNLSTYFFFFLQSSGENCVYWGWDGVSWMRGKISQSWITLLAVQYLTTPFKLKE